MTLRALLLALALFAVAPGAGAQTVPAPAPAQTAPAPTAKPNPKLSANLDALKLELRQIEAGLADEGAGEARLAALRGRLDPLFPRLDALAAEATPKLDALNRRLDAMTPKDKDGKEEEIAPGSDLAREHDALAGEVREADDTLKLVRGLREQAEQLSGALSERRRSRFAAELFARSSSLVDPALWREAFAAAPTAVGALASTTVSWATSLPARLAGSRLGGLALALLAALMLMVTARRVAARWIRSHYARSRDGHETAPLRRAYVGALVILVGLAAPVLGAAVLLTAIEGLELMPPRLLPVAGAVLWGLATIIASRALVHATFAPGHPEVRLVTAGDPAARRVLGLATGLSAVLVAGRVAEASLGAVAAPLVLSVAVKGLAALASALVLARALLAPAGPDTAEQEACLGPYVAPDPGLGPTLRGLGWLAGATILGAAVLGYVAFAVFLAEQVLWGAGVFALALVLWRLAEGLAGAARRDDGPLARTARRSFGLSPRRMEQAAVLASGFAKVVVFALGVLLALAPWGIESRDLTGSVRAALTGFQVGEVTVSISGVLTALAGLVAGVFATRAVKAWLRDTYLPTTRMDAGLANSIETAFGYLGYILALGFALSTLGLSVERLTLVAGALSVGIGFGLQSIVNNFVSGLILLWERPVRVGDWIVVGTDEGVVKRINVRSTEIETFDRSSVIVPNSNLISGTVKNRVHSDRTGRVAVNVTLDAGTDAAEAGELLLATARAQPGVLADPGPRLFLKSFGGGGLEFELFAFVGDVATAAATASELRFALLRAIKAADMAFPGSFPQEVVLRGAEHLEDSLRRLVREAPGAGGGRMRAAE